MADVLDMLGTAFMIMGFLFALLRFMKQIKKLRDCMII